MTEEVKRFKLREEKHVSTEISLMQWSPTMDLIALALANGEVIVNRLSWQRVWSYPQPDDPVKEDSGFTVSALSWRPDGKFLAIGYTNSVFRLLDVEKGKVVFEGGEKDEEITSMFWLEQAKSMCEGMQTYLPDNSATYLPSETAQQTSSPSQLSKVETQFSILIIGTKQGRIHLYAFGVFHIGVIELSNDEAYESQEVDSATLSPDLSLLSVVVRSRTGVGETAMHIHTYDTALLVSHHEEIRLLSSKFIMIKGSKEQVSEILSQMCEAWEEILREMDSKLLKFAKAKKERNEGSLSNDFLELLLFGTTSPELKAFLVQDLTAKGLKKLGYSIENSYSNIQKLVVRQLQRANQSVVSHLSDLHGMSQWYDKFGVLGLEPTTVHAAVQSAAEFALSALEMQQVIDTSIKNFKAFFRWLYIAILRLSNEAPPQELSKMTQHDIKFVADFLKDSFTNLLGDEDGEGSDSPTVKKSAGFRLEKVGQYLDTKEDKLTQPPEYSKNPWIQFVSSSSTLKYSKVLYPREMQGKPMHSRVDMLVQSYLKAETPIAKTIGNSMKSLNTFQLLQVQPQISVKPPKVCQFIDEKTSMLWMAFVMQDCPTEFLCLTRQPLHDTRWLEAVQIRVGLIADPDSNESSSDSPPCERHLLLDFAVFNTQTVTLMLKETRPAGASEPGTSTAAPPTELDTSLLVQLPLGCLADSDFVRVTPAGYRHSTDIKTVDVGPRLCRASVSYQHNILGHALAVGGVRTTASVLLPSRRRIRLYLLEDGDDDDDDDDDEGTTRGAESLIGDGSSNDQSSQAALDDSSRPEDEDKENSMN